MATYELSTINVPKCTPSLRTMAHLSYKNVGILTAHAKPPVEGSWMLSSSSIGFSMGFGRGAVLEPEPEPEACACAWPPGPNAVPVVERKPLELECSSLGLMSGLTSCWYDILGRTCAECERDSGLKASDKS